MSFRYGLIVLVAALVLGTGMLSMSTASASREGLEPVYVAMDGGGGGGAQGANDFASIDDGGTKQICETGPSSTTCVGKGWIAAGLCKALGGDIVAGDPGGVFLCEFPNRD